MTRKIIQNGTIVTLDPEIGHLGEADVLIDDGEILEIERGLSTSNAEVIDAENHIVFPGFVNSHIHLFQTQLRGIGGEWSLTDDYFPKMNETITGLYQPEDMYLGNLFGSLEQLATGTTTALDWSHAIKTPKHAERAVDGISDGGLRAVYAYGPPGYDTDEWYESTDESPEEHIRQLQEKRIVDDDRVTLALALRGPDFTTEEVARGELDLARDLGVITTIHMGIGVTASSVYNENYHGFGAISDMLGPDVNIAHANHFSQEDIEHAVEHDVSFSVTPEVEMQMGHGIPVTGELLNAGGRPSWGIDVCTSISGDMGSQMRIGLQTQRMLDNQERLKHSEEVTEMNLSCRDTLEFATIEGARALNMEDEIGTLTPGKRADIVMLRNDDFMTAPGHSPTETIVLQSDPSHIDHVMIDGEFVKRDGQLVNPAVNSEFDRFVESGRRLVEEAGIDT